MITVSVCIVTYNQEDYIAQTINGVLMQQDCNFEIIIANDASNDHTTDICRAYEARYPEKIRLIEQPYNKGIILNTKDCLFAARGKYIAICEGDDYWIDEYKLKKQIDILENKAEISMVHTNWKNYYQETKELREREIVPKDIDYICERHKGVDSVVEILTDKYRGIRFSSVCFRKSIIDKIIQYDHNFFNSEFSTLDIAIFYEAAYQGVIYYINEVTTIYRIQSESVSISSNINKIAKFSLGCLNIYYYYYKKFSLPKELFIQKFRHCINATLLNILKNKDKEMAEQLYQKASLVNYEFSFNQKLILKSTCNAFLSLILNFVVKIKNNLK